MYLFTYISWFLFHKLNLFRLVGRIYLGMHSVVDVIAGLAIGLVVLAVWLAVHEHVDNFIVSGQNGMNCILILLKFEFS